MKYSEKLKDPRWQKKRLEILERDEWCCQCCFDNETTLHVHHKIYLKGKDPWDYPNEVLKTLCEKCHEREKSERPWLEKNIIKILKLHFDFYELKTLLDIFKNLEMYHAPEVFLSVVEHHLLDEKNQRKLINEFFEHLSEKSKRKKSCQETG